tara:strand:- start:1442 stop:1744 length:303 start_codon:yes stop_codon:yes gene_type:complete
MADGNSPYVLVSVFKDDAKEQDVAGATGKLTAIIDDWSAQGNMIWSGPFDDNKTSMSVIEGDKTSVEKFFNTYNDASKSFLNSYMYQWDAMPLLSIIGTK